MVCFVIKISLFVELLDANVDNIRIMLSFWKLVMCCGWLFPGPSVSWSWTSESQRSGLSFCHFVVRVFLFPGTCSFLKNEKVWVSLKTIIKFVR